MVSGHTNAVHLYDTWFAENYNGLQKYCRRFKIDEDLLNETYINCKQRILRSGFTQTYFTTYVKRSIRNLMINEKKKENGRHFIEIDNKDYENTIENTLIENDEIDKDTTLYLEEIMFLSKMLFKYIEEKHYDDEAKFVFRCYYLMPKRFTYSKLTNMTGINKNKCTKIIQTMKIDIRNGFLIWLKDNDKR